MLVPISADLHRQAKACQNSASCFSVLVPEITLKIRFHLKLEKLYNKATMQLVLFLCWFVSTSNRTQQNPKKSKLYPFVNY